MRRSMEKKRILFVDDEPGMLLGLQSLLRRDRTRWDMVFALGGQLALDAARRQPFDLVVSDLGMPGIDGATLLSVIRQEAPTTALIMLSGHGDAEEIVRGLPTLRHLLTKPCDLATLRAAIERSVDIVDIAEDGCAW